ncbi:hypothetical protein PINS_up020888 [Pythium insidiosum]|nr:hypothetical protein PINS_up020888 [Pythium insidiosum]
MRSSVTTFGKNESEHESRRDVPHFVLQRATAVPEYNIEALELEHARTKARYVHIDAKDPNNVFSVMFRTPPASSNGIAHILEHTTLCGSRQFPVRDPFFNMIKRSLNTYMNALTAYDHTMYRSRP